MRRGSLRVEPCVWIRRSGYGAIWERARPPYPHEKDENTGVSVERVLAEREGEKKSGEGKCGEGKRENLKVGFVRTLELERREDSNRGC